MEGRIRPLLAMTTLSFRADPWRASVSTVLNIVTAISRPVFAVLLGMLANKVGNGADTSEVVLYGVLLGTCAGVNLVVSEIAWKLTDRVQEEAAHLLDINMLTTVMGVPGIEHHERPKYLDQVERLRAEYWLLAQSLYSFFMGLQTVVQILLSVAVLGGISWWLLVLPVFAIPQLLANARAERMRVRGIEAVQNEWRKSDDAIDFVVQSGPAKEVRVFGLGPELLRRHTASSRASYEREFGDTMKGAKWVAVARFIFSLAFAGAIYVVTVEVVNGNTQVGALLTTAALAGTILQQVTAVSQQLTWLDMSLTAVRRYLWLIDYGKEHRAEGTAACPDRLTKGITFENVSFAYPDTEAKVLDGIDLTLPAGSTVAIIGDNGAGKSTLIKLLTRMYEPTSGRIMVDGTPLADIDIVDWRKHLSAAFQDHARLELVAQQSVGAGAMESIEDQSAVAGAVERGGANDVVAQLPEGLNTQLGAAWSGGVDLSGGQWQKLALARAMMRDPLLLVLDEPTSALDAETEHALFERFAAAAHSRSAVEGTLTVLVSHRFSTVRMADVIIVLSGGKVVESGSHAELMAKQGLYAELYELQARAYR